MHRLAAIFTTALLVAGCNQTTPPAPVPGPERRADDEFAPMTAEWSSFIRDAAGKKVGLVTLQGYAGGPKLFVDLPGLPVAAASLPADEALLPPGIHGVHVHEVGKCEGPSFASAGGHWNPQLRQHGHKNPQGPHAGDAGNLTVDERGHGYVLVVVPTGRPHPNGLSIVIHAAADDEWTDPSGNSGARIACAVLLPPPD